MVVFFNFIKPSERKTEQTIPLQRTSDGLSRGGGFDGYFAGRFGGGFFFIRRLDIFFVDGLTSDLLTFTRVGA